MRTSAIGRVPIRNLPKKKKKRAFEPITTKNKLDCKLSFTGQLSPFIRTIVAKNRKDTSETVIAE